MSALSNHTNEVVKVLSIMATLALPMTVISSVYGTNFSNLPGAHAPYGFWVMVSGMAVLCIGLLLYFRKKSWI